MPVGESTSAEPRPPPAKDGRRQRALSGLLVGPDFYRERELTRGDWLQAVFEPVALIVAIVLFASALVRFGLSVAPGWHADGLVALCGLAAAAGYFYSRRLARGSIIWREWLVFLGPLLLAARLLPYLNEADVSLAADVAEWTRDPGTFFDPGFIFRAVLLLATWWTAFVSAQDLYGIRVQYGELPDAPARTVIERAWESDRIRSIDHTAPFRRLAARFLQGGLILIVLAALTASSVTQLMSFDALGELITLRRPASSLALVNVVAYFVVVLFVLVEAQYVRTRTLWALDKVPVGAGVATRWGAAGGLLVAVGLVAALLAPTEGLVGLGDLLHAALIVFSVLAAYVVAGIYLLFWLILYPLHWLMGSGEEDAPTPPMAAPPQMPPSTESSGSILDLVKSALFWLVLAGVLIYSLVALWRQGTLARLWPAGFAFLERIGAALVRVLRVLASFGWRAARGAADAARRLVPRSPSAAALRRMRGGLAGALPGRDPRRIVIALYGLMLARATEAGLERPVGTTATEYRARLREGLPAVAGEVDELTERFLRARYSRHPVATEDVGLARRAWEHIRRRLGGRRRGP